MCLFLLLFFVNGTDEKITLVGLHFFRFSHIILKDGNFLFIKSLLPAIITIVSFFVNPADNLLILPRTADRGAFGLINDVIWYLVRLLRNLEFKPRPSSSVSSDSSLFCSLLLLLLFSLHYQSSPLYPHSYILQVPTAERKGYIIAKFVFRHIDFLVFIAGFESNNKKEDQDWVCDLCIYIR